MDIRNAHLDIPYLIITRPDGYKDWACAGRYVRNW